MPARAIVVRLYRAAILIAIVVLIYQQARWIESRRAPALSASVAQRFFPSAQRVELRDPANGIHYAVDGSERIIGALVTTSPQADDIVGYSGPNNLLIALDTNGAVAGVELLRSGDTEDHVELIERDPSFFRAFVGWKPAREAPPQVAAVAGATLTSHAIVEAIQKRLAGSTPSLRFPEPVTITEVQAFWTNAAILVQEQGRIRVTDSGGRLLGYVVRTSPQADNISGYRGPTECLVALATNAQTILKICMRRSYDTPSYVDQIREDESYLKTFEGRTIDALATLDYKREQIEGVSGATETSYAIAESLKRRFIAGEHKRKSGKSWQLQRRDWALAAVVIGAGIMSFTRLRGFRWIRMAWQAVLMGYVGLISGDLLSLALLGGWAAAGIPWQTSSGLILLTAAALIVPWAGRRHLYCHQVCPHGAAQQWLGAFGRRFRKPHQPGADAESHSSKPRRAGRALERLPAMLLLVAVIALLVGLPLDLAMLEPFDAWVWRVATMVPITIAVIGLVASMFVSQAYCRFGCPTGALFNFLRSPGSSDRWGARDSWALVFFAAALLTVAGTRASARAEQAAGPVVFHGRTMGTTWTVKVRGPVHHASAVRQAIEEEFEAVERLTSHWRTNTPVAAFNQTSDNEFVAMPEPVLELIRSAAEISRQSDGAFDVTVGPLMKLWGFGPAPRRQSPPSDTEIDSVRQAIGWQKLDLGEGQMRKESPNMELDLSAIAPGWAIDRVSVMLQRNGIAEFLVESGGEIRAAGIWTIAVEHPARSVTLKNEAIGTSGAYRQKWRSGDTSYSHLLDPRTGRPVSHNTVSVSVRLPDCARADAWAAALNVLGTDVGLSLANDLGLAAQFVLQNEAGELQMISSEAWER